MNMVLEARPIPLNYFDLTSLIFMKHRMEARSFLEVMESKNISPFLRVQLHIYVEGQ